MCVKNVTIIIFKSKQALEERMEFGGEGYLDCKCGNNYVSYWTWLAPPGFGRVWFLLRNRRQYA